MYGRKECDGGMLFERNILREYCKVLRVKTHSNHVSSNNDQFAVICPERIRYFVGTEKCGSQCVDGSY